MQVGVPTEVKPQENRVGMAPSGVRALRGRGHTVRVQAGAGIGSGITDAHYEAAGAEIVASAEAVWKSSDLIVKVKEPSGRDIPLIQHGQTIFTFFHLAAVPELATVLLDRRVTAVAYETIQLPDGRLPLLEPMSQVAGKMSVQAGAGLLERGRGGKGVLLGGVPGVRRGRVLIIGGGTVGTSAAKVAVGMGAYVCVVDVSLKRLEYLDDIFGSRVELLHSNHDNIAATSRRSDLVVGAVLLPGAKAPRLVTREMVAAMEPGSVIVDVAIDQGGCVETIHGTTHEQPSYTVEGVVHYGVTNMPGAVAQTSTFALTNTTLEGAVKLAEYGALGAARIDKALALGINTYEGRVTHPAVAEALGLPYAPLPM